MSNSAGNFQQGSSSRLRTNFQQEPRAGWVGGRDMSFHPYNIQQPIAPQQPQQPQINPQQVQNDITMGGQWGGQPTMPQMNPFSMYGNAQPQFDWGNLFNMFGGK